MKRLIAIMVFFALAPWAKAQISSTSEYVEASLGGLGKYAVVRLTIPGPNGRGTGGSMTCVYTDAKVSYFVGCGHCESGNQDRKHGIEFPSPEGWPKLQHTKTIVIAVSPCEGGRDLSLVKIDSGPFPYVAPVAPRGWTYHGKRLLSCGYDGPLKGEVDSQLSQRPCEILKVIGNDFYTKQRPWHGRSGGGLIDQDGYLVGVVSRYESAPGSHESQHREVIPKGNGGYYPGVYASHASIVAFLDQHNHGWLISSEGASPFAPAPIAPQMMPSPTPQTIPYIDIPLAMRVKNFPGAGGGGSCGFVSVDTIARFLGITELVGFSQKNNGGCDPNRMASVLSRYRVSFTQQWVGDKRLDLIRERLGRGEPVAVGISGNHVQVLVGLNGEKVWLLANSTDTNVHDEPLSTFMRRWDGWVVALNRDSAKPAPFSPGGNAPRFVPQQPRQAQPCPPSG